LSSTVEETCSCGATFRYVGPYPSRAAKEWREGHRHAASVGICGDTPERPGDRLMPGDWPVPRPFCQLKAGHAGMHSDGEGHWTSTAPVEETSR
jgi:hypothetical protein